MKLIIRTKIRTGLMGLIILYVLVIIIKAVPVMSANAPANGQLPLEAAICVSEARTMVKTGRIHKAIVLLENFKKKQNKVDKKITEKRGYNHYYIDFLLGNYYLMLSRNVKTANSKLEKRYKKKAALSYRLAVRKKPDLFPAWLNLAQCSYELNNMTMAARSFVKAYETSKNKNGKYLYYASICFESAGEEKNALKCAVLLTKTYPLEPKWWKELSRLYLNNNDLQQGLAALISYGFLTPLKNDELLLAADLYLSLDIPSKAAFYYEKLLHKKADKKIINKIIYAYLKNCQAEKALQWINKGLFLYKSDKELLKKKIAVQAIINLDELCKSIK